MKIEKAQRRDRKIQKRNSMVVDGAFLRDIERIQRERAQKLIDKNKKEQQKAESSFAY